MKIFLPILMICISFAVQSQGISGHWHLHSSNFNDTTLITLDVVNDKVAFFNKDQNTSPDKIFYDAYNHGYNEIFDTSFTNVNMEEAYVAPFSWTSIPKTSRLNFEILNNNKLLLHSIDNHKSDFVALRSENCQEEDFCILNNSWKNPWCEITYQLPNTNWADFVDTNRYSEALFCDLYIGFHTFYLRTDHMVGTELTRSDSIKYTVVKLNFNKEGHIPFEDLTERFQKFSEKIPETEKGRLFIKIYLDKNVPLIYLQYTQIMLAESGMNILFFVNAKGEFLKKKLPFYHRDKKTPASAFRNSITGTVSYSDFCSPLSNIFDSSNYKWVGKGSSVLDGEMFVYQPKVIDIATNWKERNAKHQIQINIDKEGQIHFDGHKIGIDELTNHCYQKLPKSDKDDSVDFYIRAHQGVVSGKFLDAYSAIIRAYNQNLDELSIKINGLPYSQLTNRAQKRTLWKYLPAPIYECMY